MDKSAGEDHDFRNEIENISSAYDQESTRKHFISQLGNRQVVT